MKKMMIAALVSLSFMSLAACSKKSKCEQVYDHTLSLLPEGMKSQMSGDAAKQHAIGKCEKGSPEAQQCALDAKTFEDLLACPNK